MRQVLVAATQKAHVGFFLKKETVPPTSLSKIGEKLMKTSKPSKFSSILSIVEMINSHKSFMLGEVTF